MTDRAGLRRTAWSSSVCAGDYDNDGWLDLFVTAYGTNVLYRNRRRPLRGRHRRRGPADHGHALGLGLHVRRLRPRRQGSTSSSPTTSRFDLATAAEPGTGANCLWKGIPVNCGPKGLPTDTNLLFHNEGDGRFRDVSEASGRGEGDRTLRDDRHRRRLRRRRLAGHLRRLRLHRLDPLSQQPRRDVHATWRSRAAWPTARWATCRRGWAWPSATTTATAASTS